MSLSKFIDPSATAATFSKSSTQTLHQRISSINVNDEDTDKDQDHDAFDSESEEESNSGNELPRRRGGTENMPCLLQHRPTLKQKDI